MNGFDHELIAYERQKHCRAHPYVFQRDQGGAGNWGEVTKLTASDTRKGGRIVKHPRPANIGLAG